MNDTNFLRFLAILFIVNSHLDSYLPASLQKFATGGMIGNSLFFMLSALGLFLNSQNNKRTFIDWYGRRILRIYPSLWIVLTFILLPYSLYDTSYAQWMYNKDTYEFLQFYYLPRPPYWFLQALIIFYVPIYFLIKHYSSKLLWRINISLIVVYIWCYTNYLDLSRFTIEEFPFKLFFCWFAISLGIYLGSIYDRIQYKGFRDALYLLLCICGIYLHKWLMTKGLYNSFQIIQHILSIPMLIYFLKVSKSNFIQIKLFSIPVVKHVIIFMSGLTLEIYLAHGGLDPLFREFKIAFPINVILFISCSMFVAVLIKYVSKSISSLLSRA